MISFPIEGILSMPNYIDPGTGSLVIQVLIASLVGGLFMLKVYWRKVKAFVLRRRNKNVK